MRVLAVHEDLIVAVSAFWQTTATFVRASGASEAEEAGAEGFLIDSPVLPEELEALPSLSDQAGFPVNGLLCTHGDWDHLLGRLAFPEASLGAGEPTVARLAAAPGEAQRKLRAFDDEHYIERRRPLGLAAIEPLPVPGRLGLGEHEIELHPAPGHVADGTAYWISWLSVLVCGDYLSPVEIPMLSAGGSAALYLQTLARLSGFVDRAATVVPGHGSPLSRAEAQRVLAEDVEYLETLGSTGDAALPDRRRSAQQRRIHAENLTRLG
jgi:glyoxylase-like metal-dependent hydrolase (beta-lactamase superfamily II)